MSWPGQAKPGQGNRGWEMHQQQQLIEKKRLEIERKRRAAAATSRGGGGGGSTTASMTTAAQPVSQAESQPSSLSAATSARRLLEAHKLTSVEAPQAASPAASTSSTNTTSNVFENDGSFLATFRQMQQRHAATLKPTPADMPSVLRPCSGRSAATADGARQAAQRTGSPTTSDPSADGGDGGASGEKRRKRSRWGDAEDKAPIPPPAMADFSALGAAATSSVPTVNRTTELVDYAQRVFGTLDLTEAQWRQCHDQMKMNVLLEDIKKKKAEADRLAAEGKVKYDYDSDEETDGGTWEHKRRKLEMDVTKDKADELTKLNEGKHHIGDFLPPDELERFMENWRALKEDREPDLSDYKEFKLKEDNMGFQMLKKMGWTEGSGLGADGAGITAPVGQKRTLETAGVGSVAPANLSKEDDEFEAYRKRMMLAYKFRPNPLNNPRREYY